MEVTEKRQNGVVILVPKGRLDSNTSDEFEIDVDDFDDDDFDLTESDNDELPF